MAVSCRAEVGQSSPEVLILQVEGLSVGEVIPHQQELSVEDLELPVEDLELSLVDLALSVADLEL